MSSVYNRLYCQVSGTCFMLTIIERVNDYCLSVSVDYSQSLYIVPIDLRLLSLFIHYELNSTGSIYVLYCLQCTANTSE